MTKSRIALLTLLIIVSASFGALAANSIQKVTAYIRADFQVFLDGEKADVGPVLIYNDRSYLPLKQVGELIDAEVIWRNENKGIYINKRYPGQPELPADDDVIHDQITLSTVSTNVFTYLGGDYSVVTYRDLGKLYYREKDLNLMGIDTSGMVKAFDTFTEQLYIEESELEGAWKEQPRINYFSDRVIFRENDKEKADVIWHFIENIPLMNALARGEELRPPEFYYPAHVYTIDVLPNDEYNILTMEEGEICWYLVKLSKSSIGTWYQSQYTKKAQQLYRFGF